MGKRKDPDLRQQLLLRKEADFGILVNKICIFVDKKSFLLVVYALDVFITLHIWYHKQQHYNICKVVKKRDKTQGSEDSHDAAAVLTRPELYRQHV